MRVSGSESEGNKEEGEEEREIPTASFQCVRSRRSRVHPASSWSCRETGWTAPLRRRRRRKSAAGNTGGRKRESQVKQSEQK